MISFSFIKYKITPANNFMLKVNNRNTRKTFEMYYSELTIKAPFILNFEQISKITLVFPSLTLDK